MLCVCECVRKRDRERKREGGKVCVYENETERERERERDARERKRVCVCKRNSVCKSNRRVPMLRVPMCVQRVCVRARAHTIKSVDELIKICGIAHQFARTHAHKHTNTLA